MVPASVRERLPLEPVRKRWNALPPRLRSAVLPVGVFVLAVLYPYYNESLFEIPIFGDFPSVDTAVTMVIFIMMAIGLNIVVG